ncbi:MAG: UbiX family flavin prenyltransferase [Nanoarchaeota archaeon]|nr:UbiX family flavin prenyltransferase [Nanoarchaeota archaeon]MBU4300114.1 UbiX family flavin prenyltransferase [Nanoarchaeota archaeon]MBU4452316.1 UbiX family flavin prenyltransferase [Nanoarchaeota archaeon]MCG2723842.1 UbiX family flavin prenyltransferase [archaeon]
MKIIVAITGASGATIGAKIVEALHDKKIETHVIVSEGAKVVLKHETNNSEEVLNKIKKNASFFYTEKDLAAPIASGSFKTDGMIVAPCSMKTLAAIAHGYSDNLITRAADVCIKQKRKLVIVPRETPFSSIHLENMLKLSNQDVWIIPAVYGLFFKPKNADDIEYYIAGKVLEAFDIAHNLYKRWQA